MNNDPVYTYISIVIIIIGLLILFYFFFFKIVLYNLYLPIRSELIFKAVRVFPFPENCKFNLVGRKMKTFEIWIHASLFQMEYNESLDFTIFWIVCVHIPVQIIELIVLTCKSLENRPPRPICTLFPLKCSFVLFILAELQMFTVEY